MSTDTPPATLQGASVTVPRDPSETALVERARAGDHDAFALLLAARLPSTFRTLLAILGNESDARDATQAVFVLTWRNLPHLRDPATFPAWFGRIVVNTARSSMRGRRRRTVREISVGVLPGEGAELASGDASHEERTAALDRLERALDRLAPAERTILWLHHYEGLSLADVGARLDASAKTVKSRLFTARRALERELEAEDR